MPLCGLDASVTIAALIEEDRSDEARRILRDVVSDSATVPGLWLLEVGNVLLLAERRKSLSAAARRDHLADLPPADRHRPRDCKPRLARHDGIGRAARTDAVRWTAP